MYVCMFVYGLFGLRFIISMSCGGALSAPQRPLWLFAIFIGILSANLCGGELVRGRGAIYVMPWYRLLLISCRLLSPATDWANIYLNTFSIILGHHTAMIIFKMSCGISKGSNQSLRKTCGFQRALTTDFERQWFVAQHDSPAVGKSIIRFFSVGLQWLWFLMIKFVCVTVFQTFHFCCL